MKVKLTFDNTIPVDEIPDPIEVEADTLEEAFDEICDELDSIREWDPPIDTVKIIGKGCRDVTDEFNEFWLEEY